MNNKIKKVICKNWLNNRCRFTQKECIFAHGENDIIKNNCFNGIKCWNENCNYQHPKNWNPYDNKEECILCLKGFCNKNNKKYKHIKNMDKNEDTKENNKNGIIILPKKEDFPEIIENKHINKNVYEYKYSDILKSNLIDYKKKEIEEIVKNNDEKDELIDIKTQIKNNYMLLLKLDHKSWADYEEIDNIKDKIKILKDKYRKIKNRNKKEDIFNDNLNLDIIFCENNNELCYKNEDTFNINLTISYNEDNSNHDNIDIEKNIYVQIKNMEKDFKLCSEKIRKIINDTFKDNYLKFILINDLNEILSTISLFKNNYEDVINILG